jgi:hypothetical protein
MTGAGHRKAGRSTDLLGNCHRDEPGAPPRIPPTAATDRGFAAIDRRGLKIDIAIPDHATLSGFKSEKSRVEVELVPLKAMTTCFSVAFTNIRN